MVVGEPHRFSIAKEGEERLGIPGMRRAEEQARCVQHGALPPLSEAPTKLNVPFGNDAWINIILENCAGLPLAIPPHR
jgi:hypothetical protein